MTLVQSKFELLAKNMAEIVCDRREDEVSEEQKLDLVTRIQTALEDWSDEVDALADEFEVEEEDEEEEESE